MTMERTTSYKLHRAEDKFYLYVFLENEPDEGPYEEDEFFNGKRGFYTETYFTMKKPLPMAVPEPGYNIDDDFSVPFGTGYFFCMPYNRDETYNVLQEHGEEISRFMKEMKVGDVVFDGKYMPYEQAFPTIGNT